MNSFHYLRTIVKVVAGNAIARKVVPRSESTLNKYKRSDISVGAKLYSGTFEDGKIIINESKNGEQTCPIIPTK